jgi:hypothetical protein
MEDGMQKRWWMPEAPEWVKDAGTEAHWYKGYAEGFGAAGWLACCGLILVVAFVATLVVLMAGG